jgi:hypothetical protein
LKKSFSSLLPIKKDILRHISDLGIQIYKRNYSSTYRDNASNTWGDKLKSLEELVFDQQCQLEVTFSKRDEIFSYFVNEANSFSRLTSKIGNELSTQSSALYKKLKKLNKFAPNDSNRGLANANHISRSPIEDSEMILQKAELLNHESQNFPINSNSPNPKSLQRSQQDDRSGPIGSTTAPLYMEMRNKNLELSQEVQGLREQLVMTASPGRSMNLESKRQETYDLKFDVFHKNLESTWDLVDQKIQVYEDRISTLERFLKEKIHLLKKYQSSNDNSQVYDTYIEKLNEKVESLNKELGHSRIAQNQSQNEQKLLSMENDLKDTELETLKADLNT